MLKYRQSKRIEVSKPLDQDTQNALDTAVDATGITSGLPREVIKAIRTEQTTGKNFSSAERRKIGAEGMRKQENRNRKADREMLKRTPKKDRDKAESDLNNALKQIRKSSKPKKKNALFLEPKRIK